MSNWSPFQVKDRTYNLSHLNGKTITLRRSASGDHEAKDYTAFLTFTDHVFTDHYGDEEMRYRGERFFCTTRYELSLNLPGWLPGLLEQNPYLGRSFTEHREQFFHIEEEYQGVTYRVFIEVSQNPHPGAQLRLKVASAYPERALAPPLGRSGSFKFWRIVESKLSGIALPKNTTGRRGSRRR